ncbi:MAG: hypothetical protein J1F68_03865 [Clostridiales bacterium]|nr:hypothetical protein [Clostridiales bacterium]
MLIYDIFIALCFALLTAEVVFVAVSLVVKGRAERIAYIRSFKKGKCIVIFISALPLYFMGYLYSGANVVNAAMSTFGQVVNLVVLKYSVETIDALMQANVFYKITIYYCFVLVAVNAFMFTVSLIGQRFWQWRQTVKARFSKKDKLYIFGYNANSVNIYQSDSQCSKLIADNITDADCYAMYVRKIYYNCCRNFNALIVQILASVSKKAVVHTVIVNTENDDKNISLCNAFIDQIKSIEDGQRRDLYNRLRICVFGNPQYADIYNDIVERSNGCIRYINRYQKVAIGFIDRYPFTKFMDERHIDYSTACVKAGVDINVCMIGFGKTNQQIFLTSVANNQFITEGGNGAQLKPVRYHIFDRVSAENNKNLNHSYYRLRNECGDVNAKDYLPMPELPASEQYYHLDINDTQFYNNIRSVVSRSEADVNFAIIAFGSDLENIDMAQKLIAKRREWGITNLVIFVRVKDWKKDEHLLNDENCFVFGDEKTDVYNIDEIVRDKIFRMAHMRNEIYALEYQITSGKALDLDLYLTTKYQANRDWFQQKNQIERESNLYGCLSLRSKLNMIGLEYCEVNDERKALSEEEYLKRYATNDAVEYMTSSDILDKKVVKYTLHFPESLRKNLAILEHYRWNSFMISKGMIPATIAQIVGETTVVDGEQKYTNGKSYQLRRHGNLTTFDGLVEFRKLVSKRDNASELDKDVIKYDYQLMDDAYWLLTHNGYKIVPRT